nr:hypothetical protein [uncultured Holophaga sp.]
MKRMGSKRAGWGLGLLCMGLILGAQEPPPGPPPEGRAGQGLPPMPPPGGPVQEPTSFQATLTVASRKEVLKDWTGTAEQKDTSGILVADKGELVLRDSSLSTRGDSSSLEASSFFGLNAGVLVTTGGLAHIEHLDLLTEGTGANGIFVQGKGSKATVSRCRIRDLAQGGHAVMCTREGELEITSSGMITLGANSGAVATDRGGGRIRVTDCVVETRGTDSPAVYSTGDIELRGSRLNATGAEAAVIEGSNLIRLQDCDTTSSVMGKWGVMLYQSFSGDAEGSDGRFIARGGRLVYAGQGGPLFFVTNARGFIELQGVHLETKDGWLLKAAGSRWGRSGANGGHVVLTASRQKLQGRLTADGVSSLELSLKEGSMLQGSLNAEHTARQSVIRLDAGSRWEAVGESWLTSLDAESAARIEGKGTVHYRASASPSLGGRTLALKGGGQLLPY